MKIGEKPFNPGELRTPVLLAPDSVSTETGGFQVRAPDTANQVSVLARWVNLHGPEVWAASAEGVLEAATVTVRYLNSLNPTWFVSKDNGTSWYEIVSMDNIREYGGLMELKVKRVRAG